MPLQTSLITFLQSLSGPQAAALFLAENILLFAVAVALGAVLVKLYHARRCAPPPDRLGRREVALTVSTILINAAVTWLGWWLWRHGVIQFREDLGWGVLLDVVVLTLVMDAAMYVLHRLAHVPWLYAWLHWPHHVYERPRPLTLFVLHPLETIGFGSLWLTVIVLVDASWLGMALYLTLNVVFGVVGHLGVEPFPRRWLAWPVLGRITTSTFHAQHHQEPGGNFGFYTTVWDELFGTLGPRYGPQFEAAAQGDPPAAA